MTRPLAMRKFGSNQLVFPAHLQKNIHYTTEHLTTLASSCLSALEYINISIKLVEKYATKYRRKTNFPFLGLPFVLFLQDIDIEVFHTIVHGVIPLFNP